MSNDEVVAACKAIDDGDYELARHHINNIAATGTNPSQVEELSQLIWRRENEANQGSLNRIGIALAVAVLGYAVLSFQSPAGWGPLVWGLVAFLVLPCFVGALAGSSVVSSHNSPQRTKKFWRAFLVTSITVACYTMVGLTLTRNKMHSADKSMDFPIMMVVMLVFGGMAGLVAGIVGSSLGSPRRTS